MSESSTSADENCAADERKRKLGVFCADDSNKRPKINASLGLSLLQAYEEEEQYSDEEDVSESKALDVEITNNPTYVEYEDIISEQVISVNLSPLTTENKKEVGRIPFDNEKAKFEVGITNETNTAKCFDESSKKIQDENLSVKLEDESKDELHEAIGNTSVHPVYSPSSGEPCTKEVLSELNIRNSSKLIRPDYDSSIIGKEEISNDSNDNDLKPIKKVKLNRSKFVKPADESSNDSKVPFIKNSSPLIDQTSSGSAVTSSEEKSFQGNKNFDTVVTPDCRVTDTPKSTVNASEDVNLINQNIDDSIREEITISDEGCFVPGIHHNDEFDEKPQFDERNCEIHPSSIIEESSCSEWIDEHEEESSFEKADSVESVKDIELEVVSLETSTVIESTGDLVSDNETPEAELMCDDMNPSDKDDFIRMEEETTEKRDDDYVERKVERISNEEVIIDSILEVIKESAEDSCALANENSDNRIYSNDNVDNSSKRIVNTPENELAGMLVSEITEESIKFVNKLDHITSDEEIFEDAVETIQIVQKRDRQEPFECTSDVKSAEISKLEQALTGRLDNVQQRVKKIDEHVFGRKEVPDRELKPSFDDAKQNIKLHLSVQGDRVSIKNAQSVSEATSLPPVRVKRQYRKRQKAPGELEAKQASAKEYANRLRQRAERETPGAKKRGRKKKNLDPNPTEIILDPGSSSFPTDLTEKLLTPLTVAINKLPSQKSNVAGKVQPIKLKISKNANVTIECTSKYDVCSTNDEDNRSPINVNEKIVGILEEARKKDTPSPNYVEHVSSAWSGPDLQRVERLLKESNITITPVASGSDISSQPSSVLKPILNSKEKLNLPTSSMSVESKATASITPISEDSDVSKNVIISSKVDVEEALTPWKIIKPPISETNAGSIPSNATAAKSVDVKSEIRKKIGSVEKRKPDVLPLEVVEPVNESLVKTEMSIAELSSSTDVSLSQSPSNETSILRSDADSGTDKQITPVSSPLSTPKVHKTPTSTPASHTKLSNLPPELFPKKRGRPTKAMVAAREAYRQHQEELEKLKKEQMPISIETDTLGIVNVTNAASTEPIKIVKRGRKPKHEKLEKKDSDDLSFDESIFNPAREVEELQRQEEERIKKEEERERKNEIRRIKAKERSDLVKAKRLRQKMKAKERHKLAKELRRLQQEEKKKLEEQLKRLPVSMGFDDDTRMSAENSQAANMSFSIGMVDDDSSGATNDLSQKLKKSRMELVDSDSKDLMVDQVAEYQWPIQGGDLYMIQEQVSNFLGVKSFKRKYPDIWRRPVDSEERAYLVDSGLVSEIMCDLGITAVRSAEVLDIMCSDFPEKYEEFRRYMRDKQMKELSFKQRAWANGLGYKLLMADGSKQDMKKRAMESVSSWNLALNKSRVEDRRCHMDLQTFIIHYPKQRGAKMTVPLPKIGSYPVTILPGQFCDYYKDYTPTELRYLPVNTVLYGPLKQPIGMPNADSSQTDSDDSSSSDDSSTTSEDTQATEETVEDIEKDMGLEGSTSKLGDKDSSFIGEESVQKEMNGDTHSLLENDPSKVLCKVCLGDQFRNKLNVPEVLISCSQCASFNHPTCLDLSLNIVPRIRTYDWQCPDCKICAQCKENADEDKMLFCDTCDRGYHIYCVGLIKVPAGNWQCKECTILMIESKVHSADVSVPKESHSRLIDITG